MHSTESTPDALPDPVTGPADGPAIEASAALATELAAAREEQVRLLAEMDNLRKRAARDVEAARRYGTERLLGDLLPVADSLEAGLRVGGTDPARLAEGMAATLRLLDKALERHGLEPIDPQGAAFDPELHQAMNVVEPGGAAPGSVVTVFQKGYRLSDRLLRPAMVAVAKDAAG
jgi:molecular chaperone GrpE